MKRLLSSLLGLAIVSALMPVRAADLKPGDAAPEFTLAGTDGKTHKLSDFKGRQVVVLAWFPKAFTGGCTAECKSLKAGGEAIRKFDIAYFTASCDPIEGEKGNQAFAKSLELDFPVLSDPTQATAKAYGVVHEGRPVPERWTFYIGKDGKILAVDKDVKPATAAEDIAARLKQLGIAAR